MYKLPSINEISHFDHNQEQMYLGGGSGDGSDVNRIRKTSHKNKRLNDEDSDNYHHQTIKSSKKVKRSGTSSSSSQRKGKGNSLARVMADRGLLRTSFNADITAAEIKSVRIPPPPSLSFDELMLRINQLQLDTCVLDNTQPSITWKGHPLQIEHLPHYNVLHPTESHVVSVLRLTPIQYLTGKHTLISSARRYTEKDLPFKKSDAQKLLRIDVNKASKLWDFFHQMNWIQL
ncbi:7052_t:CDS:2 [Entrophospora sp. SA101]|nr:9899_t:CDS:2 [Entrophospora candida]CAJ0843651.1 7052_t:CDS:2 [Entrophospora sp. SA101]